MIELLSPAGGMSQLKAALKFGADAVYGGAKRFGLRAFAGNFDRDELESAVRFCHERNKRFYLTLNILPYDEDLAEMTAVAGEALEMGVDAAIVSDLGAIARLRRELPRLPIHVSTQANVMNSEAAEVFAALGAGRIVVAREMSLERIRAMKERLWQNVELEAFCHGAMCMSYSGRCMLSDHLAARGGNKGACAQPCRWQYALVEEKRPGEYIPIAGDERGTYLLSAYDLCMIAHLPDMIGAGITSLKIEGRMKTAYYVATVTSAYRRALDALAAGEKAYRDLLPELEGELRKASHRVWNTGFYYGAPTPASGAEGFSQEMEFTGEVICSRKGGILVEIRNRFYAGDDLEALTETGPVPVHVNRILREDGTEVPTVSVAGQRVWIDTEALLSEGDLLRGPNRNHLGGRKV